MVERLALQIMLDRRRLPVPPGRGLVGCDLDRKRFARPCALSRPATRKCRSACRSTVFDHRLKPVLPSVSSVAIRNTSPDLRTDPLSRIADVQLPGDRLRDRPCPRCPFRRCRRHDAQRLQPNQRRPHFFGQAFGEICLAVSPLRFLNGSTAMLGSSRSPLQATRDRWHEGTPRRHRRRGRHAATDQRGAAR